MLSGPTRASLREGLSTQAINQRLEAQVTLGSSGTPVRPGDPWSTWHRFPDDVVKPKVTLVSHALADLVFLFRGSLGRQTRSSRHDDLSHRFPAGDRRELVSTFESLSASTLEADKQLKGLIKNSCRSTKSPIGHGRLDNTKQPLQPVLDSHPR